MALIAGAKDGVRMKFLFFPASKEKKTDKKVKQSKARRCHLKEMQKYGVT
jgi:hypothetical protein